MDIKDIVHWPVALHLDLAAALIAAAALWFSWWSSRNQERINIESMRIERDNDLIAWINAVIDTIVEAEFLLRNWTPTFDQKEFATKRDASLAKIAAAIDKGRLFFPKFTLDVTRSDQEPVPRGHGEAMLDQLVNVYDFINVSTPDQASVDKVRNELMLKKREFVRCAQDEVKPERRRQFVERERKRAIQERQS
jgi:hypothetical protein